MPTHECSHAPEDPAEPCDLVAGLTAELEAIKTDTLHESWKTAPQEKLLDGLRFQGAVTRELMERTDQRLRLLKMVEWSGYDTEAGERTCPICDAWEHRRVHAYACGLAVELGSECEPGISTQEDSL